MKQDKTPLKEVDVHCELVQAVYIRPTDPKYRHLVFSGYNVQDALNNMNRWKWYERRDNRLDINVILDNQDPVVVDSAYQAW